MLIISADTPERNRKLRDRLGLDFELVSDPEHAVADAYGVPTSRNHPAARLYADGFIQPAVFVHDGQAPLFSWIQRPRLANLWGAMQQPDPPAVVEEVRRASPRFTRLAETLDV